jgi:phage shock protein PspC (stress-responsive transcriptional regulator)
MDFGNPPLRRSRDKRMIAGVLGGIAEHFDLNVTLLRVLYVIVSIASAAFPGILVYLLLWLLLPARRPEDVGPARA